MGREPDRIPLWSASESPNERSSDERSEGFRSQTCKPSFALLHHEVAPRPDKSIRVHEQHDSRQGRSSPDASPLAARTRYGSATTGDELRTESFPMAPE